MPNDKNVKKYQQIRFEGNIVCILPPEEVERLQELLASKEAEIERLQYTDGIHFLICDFLHIPRTPEDEDHTAIHAVVKLKADYDALKKKYDGLEQKAKMVMARINEREGNNFFTDRPLTDFQESVQMLHKQFTEDNTKKHHRLSMR